MLGVLILPLFYDFLIGLWNCSDSVVFLFYYYTHNMYIYCRKSFKFLECESSLWMPTFDPFYKAMPKRAFTFQKLKAFSTIDIQVMCIVIKQKYHTVRTVP
jgi:hypothetical protein